MDENNFLLTLYFIRHQESVQNRQGFGERDTELTEEELKKEISQLVKSIENLDCILTGTLKRHTQTLERIKEEVGYNGIIIPDDRLNAVLSGQMFEQPPIETEQTYQLDRFQPGSDGLCYVELPDGREISFDPVKMGIYPFNSLYSGAYFDRDLRQAVFPGDQTLASFDEIGRRVCDFQESVIEKADKASKPLNIVVVSSCSSSGFNLEYSAFGTIGCNMSQNFGSEQRRIFPQDHDEVMVLGYTKKDLYYGRESLRPIEGNVKIKNYLKK